ncbi:hypothetical protein U5A82_00845 [Sphingobium sp. CR2-8]|uniref:hypothetical protein n=1 Tax=Sphingobium sp. CR2-8 TaxID=1306534 RepID=UPI002DB83D47|nr:hypothetical protein [Sphingobium sp. CR2-8]MEC3909068.1 hypothetical protein [Sphingobium sp. CR2-8]
MSFTVSIDLDVLMPLGLRVYRGERDAVIRMLMARSTEIFAKSGRSRVFAQDLRQAAEDLAHGIRERLFQITCKPLSQRRVEDILGITSRGRFRWAKDGRLPRSGAPRIRKTDNRDNGLDLSL